MGGEGANYLPLHWFPVLLKLVQVHLFHLPRQLCVQPDSWYHQTNSEDRYGVEYVKPGEVYPEDRRAKHHQVDQARCPGELLLEGHFFSAILNLLTLDHSFRQLWLQPTFFYALVHIFGIVLKHDLLHWPVFLVIYKLEHHIPLSTLIHYHNICCHEQGHLNKELQESTWADVSLRVLSRVVLTKPLTEVKA